MQAKTLGMLTLMMFAAGCATTPDDSAICAGTADSRRALADALMTDGGNQSQRAGLAVLDQMRAGCG